MSTSPKKSPSIWDITPTLVAPTTISCSSTTAESTSSFEAAVDESKKICLELNAAKMLARQKQVQQRKDDAIKWTAPADMHPNLAELIAKIDSPRDMLARKERMDRIFEPVKVRNPAGRTFSAEFEEVWPVEDFGALVKDDVSSTLSASAPVEDDISPTLSAREIFASGGSITADQLFAMIEEEGICAIGALYYSSAASSVSIISKRGGMSTAGSRFPSTNSLIGLAERVFAMLQGLSGRRPMSIGKSSLTSFFQRLVKEAD